MNIALLRRSLSHFIGEGDQRRFLVISLTLRLVPFLTLPLISRLYSPEDFGIYAVYYGAIAIGGPLFALQAHQRVCIVNSSAVPSIIVAAHFSALLLFLLTSLALTLASLLFQIGGLAPYFLASLTSMFSASYFVTYNLMLRNEEFRMIGTRNVILAFSVPVLQIALAFVLDGYLGLILANLVSFLFLSIYGVFYVLRLNPRHFNRIAKVSYSILALKKSVRFSFSITVSGVINSLAIHSPIFFVERFLGGYQAGLLAMAFKLGQFPLDALGNYIQDLFKSKIRGKSGSGAVFSSFKMMAGVTFMCYLAIAIGISFFLPFVIPDLLGDEWVPVSEMLSIVMAILLARYSVAPFSYVLLAANKLAFNFYWQIGLLIMSLIALSSSIWLSSLNAILGVLLIFTTLSYSVLFLKSYKEAKGLS